VPLKFTAFMDGCKLHEAILREESSGELHRRWRYITTAMVKCTSRAAGPNLQRIMICTRFLYAF
jgi:hypothetical protein